MSQRRDTKLSIAHDSYKREDKKFVNCSKGSLPKHAS